MRKPGKTERAAIEAVARQFSVKPAAVVVTCIESRLAARAKLAKPRLRFDRVALRLIADLRTAVGGSVPDGETVLVTITAPIRLASRTATAMAEKIRELISSRAAPARLTDNIHGNEIRVHLLKGGAARTATLIGFVHNPDSDPTILSDVARSLLARIGSGERTTARRWLVIASADGAVPIEACRQVCSQLGVWTVFEQTLVVLPGGRIATLTA
jgi:hypothetical protein